MNFSLGINAVSFLFFIFYFSEGKGTMNSLLVNNVNQIFFRYASVCLKLCDVSNKLKCKNYNEKYHHCTG